MIDYRTHLNTMLYTSFGTRFILTIKTDYAISTTQYEYLFNPRPAILCCANPQLPCLLPPTYYTQDTKPKRTRNSIQKNKTKQ